MWASACCHLQCSICTRKKYLGSGRQKDVKIGGGIINNIRNAKDTAILIEIFENYQGLINLVNEKIHQRVIY